MNISFETCGESIVFRVSDVECKYEPVFNMCFYQRDGKNFFKKFPKDTKDIDRIQGNYARHAQEMFSQLGYFCPIPWEQALYEFVKIIDGAHIDWWLTGSCAARIRGIPFNPHDIDIMIDSKDVERIHELFVDYIVEPIIDTNGWLTKDFGVIFLHARIDIASNPQACLDHPEPVDCGPYAKEHLEEAFWKGFSIKVPPLHLQLNVNRRRGRDKRAKLLEKFLRTKS